DYFLPHFESLAKDYQLIFYYQRVSGKSSMDADSSSINLNQFIDDIDGIREAYGIKNLNLLAHSFGGLFAMKYAIKYPENIQKLMLINSIGASSDINIQSNQILGGRFTESDMTERMSLIQSEGFAQRNPETIDALMRIGFRKQFFDEDLVDSLYLNINENYGRSSELLSYLSPDLMSYDFHNDLSSIEIPTLLLYGDYDPLSNLAAPRLNQAIINSEMVIIKEAGHFPFIEKPDQFISSVTTFLNE
ncbi:MAG: alpha/beta fold hydrolase, partial [Balneolaceae bacterium]